MQIIIQVGNKAEKLPTRPITILANNPSSVSVSQRFNFVVQIHILMKGTCILVEIKFSDVLGCTVFTCGLTHVSL